MENTNFENWDEERYLELNAFFRVKIRVMLESDPYLQELQEAENGMQLDQLIGRMSEHDQQLWHEFMELDRIKLYKDMRNHLEGRGTPYNSRTGFNNNTGDDEQQIW